MTKSTDTNATRSAGPPVDQFDGVLDSLSGGSAGSNASKAGDVTQETETFRRLSETHRDPSSLPAGPPRRVDGDEVGDGSPPDPPTAADVAMDSLRQVRADRAAWFARTVGLPFVECLVRAYGFWEHQQGEPGWSSDLYWFAWLVRGHADLRPLLSTPAKAADRVELVLKGWTASRRSAGRGVPFGDHPGDPWADWFGVARRDARTEFVDVWAKARYMPGQSPLQQAYDEAVRLRLLLTDEQREARDVAKGSRERDDYEFFVGLAGHLQLAVGDRPIKLPCGAVAELLGLSKMTVSRWRRWAVADGYLTETASHKFRSKGRSDATEFRFDLTMYKRLAARAQRER